MALEADAFILHQGFNSRTGGPQTQESISSIVKSNGDLVRDPPVLPDTRGEHSAQEES
jgi:hypothetical protein